MHSRQKTWGKPLMEQQSQILSNASPFLYLRSQVNGGEWRWMEVNGASYFVIYLSDLAWPGKNERVMHYQMKTDQFKSLSTVYSRRLVKIPVNWQIDKHQTEMAHVYDGFGQLQSGFQSRLDIALVWLLSVALSPVLFLTTKLNSLIYLP